MRPSVSAIVPVHDGAAHIADALRSIRAQTVPVAEVIVVDDASDDETLSVVRSVDSDATILRQVRSGPAMARNAGASLAGGELLGFLDHDDLWPPDRTAALLDGLAAMPEAGLVCGRVSVTAAEGEGVDPRLRQADGTHIPFLFSSTLVRRDVWSALGGMRPVRDYAEDLDAYLRLVEAGVPVASVEATTLVYRQHGGNRSRDVDLSSRAMLATMRAAILRRRRQAG